MAHQPRLPVALPDYSAELVTRQRSGVRTAMLLAAPILVAFSALDLATVPQKWLLLLGVRLAAAAALLVVAHAVRDADKPQRLAYLSVWLICLTIEIAVFFTGGAHSPYLISNIIVIAGVGLMLPLTGRQALLVQATGLFLVIGPLVPGLHRADVLPLATTASYLVSIAILAVAGAQLQDRLRRGEHRARIEVARQMGLINLGTLAGGLAHELSNPLTYVALELEMLLSAPLDPAVREKVGLASSGLLRMTEILRAMRQGARFADGDLREVQLGDEIDQALTLVAQRLRGANVTVVREYAPDTPVVACQPTLLGQVLVNLVLNAVDAMAGRKDARLTLRVRAEADCALVEVEDSGPGVPEAVRARIFEPFFSTKGDKGNGLGLWISSEIARVHGGSLTALPGEKGALFRLSLPCEPPLAAISAA